MFSFPNALSSLPSLSSSFHYTIFLSLPHPPTSPGSSRLQSQGECRSDGGSGGPERLWQEHHSAAASAVLRCGWWRGELLVPSLHTLVCFPYSCRLFFLFLTFVLFSLPPLPAASSSPYLPLSLTLAPLLSRSKLSLPPSLPPLSDSRWRERHS